jgi:hypothetical protein
VSQAARVFAAMAPHQLKEGFHTSYEQAETYWDHAVKNGDHTASEAERK